MGDIQGEVDDSITLLLSIFWRSLICCFAIYGSLHCLVIIGVVSPVGINGIFPARHIRHLFLHQRVPCETSVQIFISLVALTGDDQELNVRKGPTNFACYSLQQCIFDC